MPVTVHPALRQAIAADCGHLALLADMATRRLASHLWSLAAAPGQSVFEVGRMAILENRTHFSHVANWRVAESAGQIAGAVNGYIIPPPGPEGSTAPDVVRPLNELKAMAAGTWYASAIALFPEFQGRGFGKALLQDAVQTARRAGALRLTLMVGSFNQMAHRLYLRDGFSEVARRPFLPFPGSDTPGEWILMGKDVG